MLSTSFEGMKVPVYSDKEISEKLSQEQIAEYMLGIGAISNSDFQTWKKNSKGCHQILLEKNKVLDWLNLSESPTYETLFDLEKEYLKKSSAYLSIKISKQEVNAI